MGKITFARADVETIETGLSAVHKFDQRFATVARDDLPALQLLAQWAQRQGLRSRAYTLHTLVVMQAPDNAVSRKALGHVRQNGQWVDPNAAALAARQQEVQVAADELRAERAAEAAKADKDRALREQAQAIALALAQQREPAPAPPSIWTWTPVSWWGRPCVANGLQNCASLLGVRRGPASIGPDGTEAAPTVEFCTARPGLAPGPLGPPACPVALAFRWPNDAA